MLTLRGRLQRVNSELANTTGETAPNHRTADAPVALRGSPQPPFASGPASGRMRSGAGELPILLTVNKALYLARL
jgi:hypothetical protein